MWTKFSVEVLFLLALIPLPGPSIFKIACCRDNSRVVRKIVQSKLLPVLEKYNVKLGLECPFHPDRDLFAPQQAAKQQDRPSQWTCGVCGKSFYEEKFLDLHFEQRHKERINTAEDAVCLSNFCDIMRCDVLVSLDGTLMFGNRASTDIEVWNEASARTAVATTTKSSHHTTPVLKTSSTTSNSNHNRAAEGTTSSSSSSTSTSSLKNKSRSGNGKCDPRNRGNRGEDDGEEDDDEDEDDNGEESAQSCDPKDAVVEEDATPVSPLDKKQQRIAEMQRMKANCKKEELDGLRAKCQVLIRDCIGGLLIKLSQQEFKEMEDELNRKICWYLSCDRYWEDGPPDRRACPWLLLIVIAAILSCGICLCYYIIWVLFDSDDYKFFMNNSSNAHHHSSQPPPMMLHHHPHDHPSPTHSRSYVSLHVQQQNMLNNMILSETPSTSSYHPTDCLDMNEVATLAPTGTAGAAAAVAGQSEHYIYVTYPPELKRRLLESCYNRTTRL